MNGCEGCIVYEIRHNHTKAGKCMGCGKDTWTWKMEKFGTPYLKCSECSFSAGVDLNTPCEEDPVFHEKLKIFIDPQKELPDKSVIMILAKEFGMNILQMHKSLKEGFSMEMPLEKLIKVTLKLEAFGMEYRMDNFVDPREKYPFYQECGYAYSTMRIYMNKDDS